MMPSRSWCGVRELVGRALEYSRLGCSNADLMPSSLAPRPLDLSWIVGHRRPLLLPDMRLAERHGSRTQDASRAYQHGAAADRLPG